MRKREPRLILSALLVAGCASGGPSGGEEQGVPVFGPDEETPCDYEEIGLVSVEVTLDEQNLRVGDDTPRRALAREGARRGADAVILRESRRQIPFDVVTDSRTGHRTAIPVRARFDGLAVTWIEGTCKR